jgi:protein-S-isoprenylcysteine O-methyltransferase Ste14
VSTQAPVLQTPTAADLRRGMIRSLCKSFAWLILSAAILFGVSGIWRWLSAWAFLAIGFLSLVVGAFTLPAELLNERSSVKQGAKEWDRRVVLAFMITGIAVQVTAALDVRYCWSPSMPVLLKAVALVVLVASFWLVHWAMRSNRFFSPIVRIQVERGHAVVTSGPYMYMRHPGYLGIIVSQFAVPVLLGSRLAFLIGVCGNVLLVVRTALEDRTLQRELAGYAEYAQRVHYRLLPGIW